MTAAYPGKVNPLCWAPRTAHALLYYTSSRKAKEEYMETLAKALSLPNAEGVRGTFSNLQITFPEGGSLTFAFPEVDKYAGREFSEIWCDEGATIEESTWLQARKRTAK